MLGRDPGFLKALCGLEDAARPELLPRKHGTTKDFKDPRMGRSVPH